MQKGIQNLEVMVIRDWIMINIHLDQPTDQEASLLGAESVSISELGVLNAVWEVLEERWVNSESASGIKRLHLLPQLDF